VILPTCSIISLLLFLLRNWFLYTSISSSSAWQTWQQPSLISFFAHLSHLSFSSSAWRHPWPLLFLSLYISLPMFLTSLSLLLLLDVSQDVPHSFICIFLCPSFSPLFSIFLLDISLDVPHSFICIFLSLCLTSLSSSSAKRQSWSPSFIPFFLPLCLTSLSLLLLLDVSLNVPHSFICIFISLFLTSLFSPSAWHQSWRLSLNPLVNLSLPFSHLSLFSFCLTSVLTSLT